VQAAPAADVGHERVAGREPAARERKRERRSGKSRSRSTARRRSSRRSRAPGRSGSWSPRESTRWSSSSRRSGPSGRLDPVGLGLGDGDRSAGDRRSERWLELPEAGLPLTMPLR
jgi:hypothetical protein